MRDCKTLLSRKLLICLIFTQTLALFQGVVIAQSVEKKLSVGLLTPLTGSAAEQGYWVRQGAELAKEVAEEMGWQVELKLEDTVADPKTAIAAYQRLKSSGPLNAIITYGSGVAMALSPICNQQEVIQIGVATATPAYKSPDDFTFRNFPSAELETDFLVKAIQKTLPSSKLSLVHLDNEYGVGTANAFNKAFTSAGGQIVEEITLQPSAIDYRTQIIKLKNKDTNAIFLASYPAEGALFLKQLREMGVSAPVFASVAIVGAKNFFKLAGVGGEGLYISTSIPAFLESQNPAVEEFSRRYQKKYGEEPSVEQLYAARAYDAVLLLVEAAKGCPSLTSHCLKDSLFNIKNFSGPSGTISFDRFGDVSTGFSLLQVKNGKFLPSPGNN